ncbi:MAG: XdhC family protein [Eubacteriales bacterium]|nr:XdhC family protein [Eubacteriales bacterium]
MYRKLYELLDKQGKVKRAVFLDGIYKGESIIGQERAGDFWNPYLKEIERMEETRILDTDKGRIFVEILEKNPHLVILGGGHVSCPVAHIAKMLGFHVTVMDDREEFLTKERFPDADECILGSFDEFGEKIPVYENAYYVVVTRGHQGDTLCARQILRRPYTYFGMIGSRTKVKLTREMLLSEGFEEKQLASIHAPIGLPIGGETPEEIAVSIMAEIVQIKNQFKRASNDERIEKAVSEGLHGTMLTIVRKSGSSPRGVGSKMFLDREGNLYGTIGGGSVEFQALCHAEKRNATNTGKLETIAYNLSQKESADLENLGMICGGNVEVLFENL